MSLKNFDILKYSSEELIFLGERPIVTEHNYEQDQNFDEEIQKLISIHSEHWGRFRENLFKICQNDNHKFHKANEFRLELLQNLWKSRLKDDESIKQDLCQVTTLNVTPDDDLRDNLTFFLLFPVLESVQKVDPSLKETMLKQLKTLFLRYKPLSIQNSYEILDKIQTMIRTWITSNSLNDDEKKSALEVLILMSITTNSVPGLVNTVHLFNSYPDFDLEPSMKESFKHVQDMNSRSRNPVCIGNSTLGFLFQYDDRLNGQGWNGNIKQSITIDTQFIYLTDDRGHGLVKIGTGQMGTARGREYARNPGLDPGYVTVTSGQKLLLQRPHSFDDDQGKFAIMLNSATLQIQQEIANLQIISVANSKTLGFLSDGRFVYWVRKQHQVIRADVVVLDKEKLQIKVEKSFDLSLPDEKFDYENAKLWTDGQYLNVIVSTLRKGRISSKLCQVDHSFSLENGHRVKSTELEGIPLLKSICFDPLLNQIWMISNDLVLCHDNDQPAPLDVMDSEAETEPTCRDILIRHLSLIPKGVLKGRLAKLNKLEIFQMADMCMEILTQISGSQDRWIQFLINVIELNPDWQPKLVKAEEVISNFSRKQNYPIFARLHAHLLKLTPLDLFNSNNSFEVQQIYFEMQLSNLKKDRTFGRNLTDIMILSDSIKIQALIENLFQSGHARDKLTFQLQFINYFISGMIHSTICAQNETKLREEMFEVISCIIHCCWKFLQCNEDPCILLDMRLQTIVPLVCTFLSHECFTTNISDIQKIIPNLVKILNEMQRISSSSPLIFTKPWIEIQRFESRHPLIERIRQVKTISYTCAKSVFLKFDSRSLLMDQNDKLCVHMGDGAGGPKVIEITGGQVLPKDIIEVHSDTVTIVVEMNGSSQLKTWGVRIDIAKCKDAFSSLNSNPIVPSLMSLVGKFIFSLYYGDRITPEEKKCSNLFQSSFLQTLFERNGYKIDVNAYLSESSSDQRKDIKDLSVIQTATIRPSLRNVFQVDQLENHFIDTILFHMIRPNRQVGDVEGQLLQNIANVISVKFNALLRKLQSLAQLEQTWQVNVMELGTGELQMEDTFFLDMQESPEKEAELDLLSHMKGIDVNMASKDKIAALTKIIEQESRTFGDNKSGLDEFQFPFTKRIVDDILKRLKLIQSLSVSSEQTTYVTKSLQNLSHPCKKLTKRKSVELLRLHRRTVFHVEPECKEDVHPDFIGNLFQFCSSFLLDVPEDFGDIVKAIEVRQKRNRCRIQSLALMKSVVAGNLAFSNDLIEILVIIILNGPLTDDLTFSSLKPQVMSLYGDLLQLLVLHIKQNPIENKKLICTLSQIPLSPSYHHLQIKSGFLDFIGNLCALQNDQQHEEYLNQPDNQQLATLAWMAFKMVAIEYSDHAQEVEICDQLSSRLSKIFSRFSGTKNIVNYVSLEESLHLLTEIRHNQLGKGILRQSSTVATLLNVLQIRLPPKCHFMAIKLIHSSFQLVDHMVISEKLVTANLFAALSSYMFMESPNLAAFRRETSKPDPDNESLSLFVHKPAKESSHGFLQTLIDLNHRLIFVENIDEIEKLERDLNRNGRLELFSLDLPILLERAQELTDCGYVVSISNSVEIINKAMSTHGSLEVCKARNKQIYRDQPPPLYVNRQVARSLSREIVALIHFVVQNNAKILNDISQELDSQLKLFGLICNTQVSKNTCQALKSHCQAVDCALAVLGAFTDHLIQEDSVVTIDNKTQGTVKQLNRKLDLAKVMMDYSTNQVVECNLSRLNLVQDTSKGLKMLYDSNKQSLIRCFEYLLPSTTDFMSEGLPCSGNGMNLELQVARMISQTRLGAFNVLRQFLQHPDLAIDFLKHSGSMLDVLKYVSTQCLPSDRLRVIEGKCLALKDLYADPTLTPGPCLPQEFQSGSELDLLHHDMTSVLILEKLGEIWNIKGENVLFGSHPVHYFEVSMLCLREEGVKVGFTPKGAVKWESNGCITIDTQGNIISYGENNSYESKKTNMIFSEGDTVGMGRLKHHLILTLNGKYVQEIEYPPEGVNLYPAIHMTKAATKFKWNFGKEPFLYQHVDTITDTHPKGCHDAFEEVGGHRRTESTRGRPALSILKAQPDFPSRFYRTSKIPIFKTGHIPIDLNTTLDDYDSDIEDDEEDEMEAVIFPWKEDLNQMLIRSWESKVFPIIGKRFRNESERRDGLEQIRGALTLGMEDIAKQTVEFLFEDNGGMPRDLKLPSISDIKQDMTKLTIDSLQIGDKVKVNDVSDDLMSEPCTTKHQFKTFGLSGVAIEKDYAYKLVQVEAYLKEEGVLVQYWYPISVLQRGDEKAGTSKTRKSNLKRQNLENRDIHKELLNLDFALGRLYCREAYISLIGTAISIGYRFSIPRDEKLLPSNLMMLQDFDFENLQLISSSCFQDAGNLANNSLVCVSPTQFMQKAFKFDLTFHNGDLDLLRNEIRRHISMDSLELCRHLDEILGDLSQFTFEEVVVNDVSHLNSVIHLRNASFTLVTPCFSMNEALSHPKDLKIEIQTFDSAEIKRNGRFHSKDIIHYPVKDFEHLDCFPTSVIPSDNIRVSHSGGGEDLVAVRLLGVPEQFPLALEIIDCMIEHEPKDEGVLKNIASSMTQFLLAFPCPPSILCHRIVFYLVKALNKIPDVTSLQEQTRHLINKLQDAHLSPLGLELNFTLDATNGNETFKILDKLQTEITDNSSCIKSLNCAIFETKFLDDINFEWCLEREFMASLLRGERHILDENLKNQHLDKLVNASSERIDSQYAPVIDLDPVQHIGTTGSTWEQTWFYKVMKQLEGISSSRLLVPLIEGGDPNFPFQVKLFGEEVQGNSGSFRLVMSRLCDELASARLPILTPYTGSGGHKGHFFLRSQSQDKNTSFMLRFLGQLIGVAIRSRVPLKLNLMPTFWKSFLLQDIEEQDVEQSDPDFWNYLNQIEGFSDSDEFEEFLEGLEFPTFSIPSLTEHGAEQEICDGGRDINLDFDNRLEYVGLARKCRARELQCQKEMAEIHVGFATIIGPFHFIFMTFTPGELETRICGPRIIDLSLLKKHTRYQSGLQEGDKLIQNFWKTLESFNQTQIQMFIKFACNQERLPNLDTEYPIPPLPMKIASANVVGQDSDSQLIRAETCMFLIKLPNYSNNEILKKNLLTTLNCSQDPLSG